MAAGCTGGNKPDGTKSPAGTKFPVTVKAANGDVEIRSRPERIVSLSPTATEMLFAIGAGGQVAAADEFSNYPAEAPKTDLSGFTPNVEAIVGHRPDLVVTENEGLVAALGNAEVPVIYQPTARKLEDSYTQMEQLGLATGNSSKAKGVVARMKSDIRELVESVPSETKLTYYHEIEQTFFTATSKTFIGQVYSLLGLENIADEADTEETGGFPQLSAEYIVNANPDFIFLADTKCCGQSPETVAARPGWDQIKAVQQGQVIPLDDDIASRWGPRVVDFLRTVTKAILVSEPAGT
ncbi:MAG TPA: ABC transporter substrate-binding protein [Actinomycetota bacterium]|nr:ABC transporter substrate-binding protein [Actinomycetota bacterium]